MHVQGSSPLVPDPRSAPQPLSRTRERGPTHADAMLPELGQFALVLALLVSVLQAILPLVGAQRGIAAWTAVARPAAYAQLALVALAFAILTHAFVVQDFSLRYVAQNSNSLLPVMYRYSAVWGAHEGSLLLWALAASAAFLTTLRELAAASRRFDEFVRQLSRFNRRAKGNRSLSHFISED